MTKKNFLRILQFAGLVIFVLIIANLDLKFFINRLVSFKWHFLLYYSILTLIILILKTIRWSYALKCQGIFLPLTKMLAIYATSSFWGIITPGKIGELGKVIFLQKEDLSFTKSAVSVIIDRLYDIGMLFIFGLISVIYFSNYLKIDSSVVIFLICALFIIMILFFYKKGLSNIIKKLIRFFIPSERYYKLVSNWEMFLSEFKYVQRSTYIPMSFLTLLVYISIYLQIYLITVGFGLYPSFLYLALCLTIATIISILPISIGGLGTREAVFIFFLTKVSISPEEATLISLLDSTFLSLILMGFFMIIFSSYTKIKYLKKNG